MGDTVEVKARKLEQFLFMHGIDFTACRKDPNDGMTVWEYPRDDETERVIEEYRLALRKRLTQKGA